MRLTIAANGFIIHRHHRPFTRIALAVDETSVSASYIFQRTVDDIDAFSAKCRALQEAILYAASLLRRGAQISVVRALCDDATIVRALRKMNERLARRHAALSALMDTVRQVGAKVRVKFKKVDANSHALMLRARVDASSF